MVDVFISYSRDNQAVVRRLAEAVAGEGYSVWWDAELPPHLSYGDVITEKIGAAKAAIVVWSKSAAASEWVRAEADVARGQKKLIQTSIDDVMPPMPFNQIQFASIGDWGGETDHPGWNKVKMSLEALCGDGEGSRAPLPPPQPMQSAAAAFAPPPAGRGLLIGLLGLLALLAGAAILLLWMRESDSSRPADPPAPVAAPEEPGAPAGEPLAALDEPSSAEAPPGGTGEILPESDSRLLIEEDLEDLSKRDLFIARNEIFARHGREFASPELRRHFSQLSWYRPHDDEIRLSPVEQANVRLIAREEQER